VCTYKTGIKGYAVTHRLTEITCHWCTYNVVHFATHTDLHGLRI